MSKGWSGSAVLLVVFGTVAAGPLGGALGLVAFSVEAEARTADAGPCAPDGERMRVFPTEWASGLVLEFPNHLCWAEWTLALTEPTQGVTVFFQPPGGGLGDVECMRWLAQLDTVPAGVSDEHCGGPHGANGAPLRMEVGDGIVLGSGVHTLRLTMVVTRGPTFANAYVDLIELGPALAPPPAAVCQADELLTVCLQPTAVVARFAAVGAETPDTHHVAGHVDRYSFALPTGGRAWVPCFTAAVDATEVNECAAAGGTFEERVATLVDEPAAVPGSADAPVQVCIADLTVTVGGFGIEGVPVRAPC